MIDFITSECFPLMPKQLTIGLSRSAARYLLGSKTASCSIACRSCVIRSSRVQLATGI